jgi:hypothetical protein
MSEPMRITPELNQLWVHLKSEHEDIRILKDKLAKAERRAQKLSDQIQALCRRQVA